MATQFEKIITKYLCSKSFGSIRNILGPSKAWNTYQAPKSTTILANYDLPKSLPLPPYVTCGEFRAPTSAEIKTDEQINQMRPACKLAASILRFVGENIKVGMTTNDIDALVYSKCIEAGAYPSPLNYKGFPKCVCTSVNEVACHGVPGNLVLKDGDIINVDITVYYNGYHGDTSHTFMVGDVDKRGKALVKAAEKCRDAGIGVCHNGALISDIGDIIYSTAMDAGFEVLPFFCGHGIGHYFHGPPDIVHVPSDFVGDQKMLTGMTFTIEPIVCDGKPEIKILEDDWTVVAVDGSRSAQFEHTILITDNGMLFFLDLLPLTLSNQESTTRQQLFDFGVFSSA